MFKDIREFKIGKYFTLEKNKLRTLKVFSYLNAT